MIYADNASTTQIRPEVLKVMHPWLTSEYGNPSSAHSLGREAFAAIEAARHTIAEHINCLDKEIIFTSGASEANTQAILSLALNHKDGGLIISQPTEHKSVLHALECLSDNGYDVSLLPVSMGGTLDIRNVFTNELQKKPILVTCMGTNNETGVIFDTTRIGDLCYNQNIPFHMDATQDMCHRRIDVQELKVTTMSASAHKFNGPKGIGFLYVNRKWLDKISPMIQGGDQNFGLRPGTENVAGIIGMAEAMLLSKTDFDHARKVGKYFANRICSVFPNVVINGRTAKRHNGTTFNVDFSDYNLSAEQILEFLNDHDIMVSSGSACNSKSNEPSYVLKSMGLTDEQANSSIRFSFGVMNTEHDVDEIILALISLIELVVDKS